MPRFALKRARTSRHADARARRRLIAAIGCSLLVHALITTGVPPGQRGHSGSIASAAARAAFEVELLDVTPSPPLVSTLPEADAVTSPAPAPRSERKEPRQRQAAAGPVEGSLVPDGVGPTDVPDPTYYGARQLDVYPALAGTLRLNDREGAPAPRRAGRVLLLVLIDAEGWVNEVSVIEAEPPGVFEEHTRAAFQAARFSPALRNGRPVKSRLLVDVDYSDNTKH